MLAWLLVVVGALLIAAAPFERDGCATFISAIGGLACLIVGFVMLNP